MWLNKSCLITDFDGNLDDLFMLYADMANIGIPPLYMILSDEIADRIEKEVSSFCSNGSYCMRASALSGEYKIEREVWIGRVGLVFPGPCLRFEDLGPLPPDRWKRLELVHGLWPDWKSDHPPWFAEEDDPSDRDKLEFYGQRD